MTTLGLWVWGRWIALKFRALEFWERVRGVSCVGCLEVSHNPYGEGWRYSTLHNGTAAWLCRECYAADCEHPQLWN